jgi:hypothetical protein|nr:MAG TPA: hypothetical protein [Caudoviricetes sp.]
MTDYEEFLVSVEIAKELKEIGFNEPCLFVLNPHNTLILSSEVHDKGIIDIRKIKPRSNGKLGEDFCSVPTYEQVFAWFRKKGLYGNIEAGSKYNSIYIFSDNDLDMGNNIYPTHEEAREELLKRFIKIYKENI